MNDLLGKSSLKLLLYQFKESPYYSISVFLCVFLVAVLLVVYAVMPQIQNVFVLNEEINATRDRIKNLQNNKLYLSNLLESNLDEDLEITFSALPSDKDFVGIINNINSIAAKSGVVLEDYDLAIGELATPSGGLEVFFPLAVDLELNGNEESLGKFLTMSQEGMPLSEIQGLDTDLTDSSVKFIFFFKVYKGENYSVARPIAPMSDVDLRTLNTLKEWKARDGVVIGDDESPVTEPALTQDPF